MNRIWNQKPPLGSKINWNHPLSKGLIGCWLFNGSNRPIEIVNNIYPISTSNIGVIVTTKGISGNFNLGSSSKISYGAVNSKFNNIQNGNFSVLGGYYPKTLDGTNGRLIGKRSTAGTNKGWSVYINSTNILFERVCLAGENYAFLSDGVNNHLHWAFTGIPTTNNTTDVTCYKNGIRVTPSTATCFGGTYVDDTTAEMVIGNMDNLDRPCRGYFTTPIMIYNRILTAQEIKSLYYFPYQFINRPSMRTYNVTTTPPAEGAGYMTCNRGFWGA